MRKVTPPGVIEASATELEIRFIPQREVTESFLSFLALPRVAVGPLRRLVEISLTTWLALAVYFVIARAHSAIPTSLEMPGWVPFWPAFTLPYLTMLLVTWLLPLAICDPVRFRACLIAFICAFLMVMPWWILVPTTLPRPPLPVGWWFGPYRWLAATDPPTNVMPCAHGIGPVIAAWFVGRERPRWRWPLVGMLVFGLPSISLVWQHRPVDIMLGTVAAMVGVLFGEALNRLNRSPLLEPQSVCSVRPSATAAASERSFPAHRPDQRVGSASSENESSAGN